MSDAELAAAALQQTKAMGCLCKPDVELDRDPDEPLLVHANVFHDAWCPLYMSRKRGSN